MAEIGDSHGIVATAQRCSRVAPLRLEVRPHDVEAAHAAGEPVTATGQHGRVPGDRTGMALGMALGAPVLTAGREWAKVGVEGLAIEMVR